MGTYAPRSSSATVAKSVIDLTTVTVPSARMSPNMVLVDCVELYPREKEQSNNPAPVNPVKVIRLRLLL